MGRQLTGALLIAAVIAAAITVPARDGLRVPGVATMIELPADPRIGDCLVEPTAELPAPNEPRESSDAASVSRRWDAESVYSQVLGARFGACDGRRAGEVVSIVTAAGNPADRRIQVRESGVDCRTAGLEYAGLVSVGDHFALPEQPAADPVTWRLSIGIRTAWILPSPLLQAAGRTWAACVVAPIHGGSFVGRLADAFNGGAMPSEYGTCWNSREVSASIEPVNCAEPHFGELISTGFVPDRSLTTTEEVRNSCQQLAARVARRDDPTAGGALMVRTSPDSLVTRGSGVSVSIMCYFTAGDRPLAGSLVGLGDQPVPYAN